MRQANKAKFPSELALVLALGLVTGLWGIRWGLPGAERLRAFPDGRPTPEVAQYFADAWMRLYQEIQRAHQEVRDEPETRIQGVEEIPPGWHKPPEKLVNSYRSLLLQSDHPDEKKSFIILSQMRPWKLEFKPLYLFYGGAFIYPLGAFLQMNSWLGTITLVPDIRHYMLSPEDMGGMYLCGRIFILLFHLGTLWMLFDLGRLLSSPRTGLFAALFFALCPAAVVHSHLIKPHPYATFWVLASLRHMLKAYQRGAKADYLLSGIFAGMASGSNFSLAALSLMPAIPWVARRHAKIKRLRENKDALSGLFCAGATCLAANPYLVFCFRDFAWDRAYVSHVPALMLGNIPATLAAFIGVMGTVVGTLALAGAVSLSSGKKERRMTALVLWGLLATLWFQFSVFAGDSASLRLFHPVLALTCLAASDLVCSFIRSRALQTALLAAALLDGGLRSFVYLENMRLHSTPESTRSRSVSWVERNVPAGATIGLFRYPEPSHTPPLRFDRYRLVVFDRPEGLKPGKLPDYILVDYQGRALVDQWAQGRYALAASFLPFQLGWARVDADSFINGPLFIYRRLI